MSTQVNQIDNLLSPGNDLRPVLVLSLDESLSKDLLVILVKTHNLLGDR